MPPVDFAQASRISLEQDSVSNVGPFYVLLAQARSHLSPSKLG